MIFFLPEKKKKGFLTYFCYLYSSSNIFTFAIVTGCSERVPSLNFSFHICLSRFINVRVFSVIIRLLLPLSIIYPFHLIGFIFVVFALQDLVLNRLLSITTVLTLCSEPMSPVALLPSYIHRRELRLQTLQLLLKHLSPSYNSLFEKNEILTGECCVYALTASCRLVPARAPGAGSTFPPSPSNPSPTPATGTDQSGCVFLTGQPVRKLPRSKYLLSVYEWGVPLL